MEKTLKEAAEELMSLEGRVKGEKFKTHARYIRKREGEKGLRAVEEKMTELGYPFSFNDMASLDWYPVGLSVVVMLICEDLFGWKEKDMFDMGYWAPQESLIVKMVLRYLVSLQRMVNESQLYWDKHYDFGKFESEADEKRKRVIVKISGFNIHPIMCPYLKGYVFRVFQYVTKGVKARIDETKCSHKGDSHHEYLISWE